LLQAPRFTMKPARATSNLPRVFRSGAQLQ